MVITQPTTSHKKLELMAGTWSGEETCHPSPWNPALKKVHGRSVHRVAMGGFHVLGDYEQVENGEVGFTGHAVYSFDEATEDYVCHWFDSMWSGASVLRGKWEGDVLTMTNHDPKFGHCKLIYRMGELEQGRYSFRMEMSQDGEEWNVCMEGDYRRAD